jgi:hypothetical protein
MSFIKINSNLFLGSSEMNRLQTFLSDNTIRRFRQDTHKFGFFYNQTLDPNFINGLVEEATASSVKINAVVAVDKEQRLITKNENSIIDGLDDCPCSSTNLTIPDDGSYYWIRVRHKYDCAEEGTVEVTNDGRLLGTDTKFTEVLRGGDFQSVIVLKDSSLNPVPIHIASVVSDTEANLLGAVNAETDLTYCVRGTFSTGYNPTTDESEIFQYDSSDIKIEVGSGTNGEDIPTPGTLPNGETEVFGENSFFLARVRNNGGTIEILDKREDLFKLKGDYLLTELDKSSSPIAGVEFVKYDAQYTTKDRNIVRLGFGVRATAWSASTTTNTVTLSTASGGILKITDDFVDNQFNGWVCYFPSVGRFAKVLQSTKNGTSINLKLDTLLGEDIEDTTQTLVVSPNVESVEVKYVPNDPYNSQGETFSIGSVAEGYVESHLPVLDSITKYEAYYRYVNHKERSEWFEINKDQTNAYYYTEEAFDTAGVLVDTNQTKDVLVDGLIEIVENAESYSSFITGDKFGYETFELTTASNYKSFEVGVNTKNQKWEGTQTSITNDHFIDLSTANAKAGNSFYFELRANIQTNPTNAFLITQDFDGVGTPAQVLYDLSASNNAGWYYSKMKEGNLRVVCEFDGTNWIVNPLVSEIYRVSSLLRAESDTNSGVGSLAITTIFTDILSMDVGDIFTNDITSSDEVLVSGSTNIVTRIEDSQGSNKIQIDFQVIERKSDTTEILISESSFRQEATVVDGDFPISLPINFQVRADSKIVVQHQLIDAGGVTHQGTVLSTSTGFVVLPTSIVN